MTPRKQDLIKTVRLIKRRAESLLGQYNFNIRFTLVGVDTNKTTQLLIAAAKGGLKAAPESRPRWAYHHRLPSIEHFTVKELI